MAHLESKDTNTVRTKGEHVGQTLTFIVNRISDLG